MSAGVDKRRFAPVQFGFDSYVVSGSEQSKVNSVAASMKGSSDSLIIAGFTDERGTAEYNRGLGERRAQAVRQALGALEPLLPIHPVVAVLLPLITVPDNIS